MNLETWSTTGEKLKKLNRSGIFAELLFFPVSSLDTVSWEGSMRKMLRNEKNTRSSVEAQIQVCYLHFITLGKAPVTGEPVFTPVSLVFHRLPGKLHLKPPGATCFSCMSRNRLFDFIEAVFRCKMTAINTSAVTRTGNFRAKTLFHLKSLGCVEAEFLNLQLLSDLQSFSCNVELQRHVSKHAGLYLFRAQQTTWGWDKEQLRGFSRAAAGTVQLLQTLWLLQVLWNS